MLYILDIVLKMKQCFGKLKVDDDHFASGVSGWLFYHVKMWKYILLLEVINFECLWINLIYVTRVSNIY